MRGLLGKLTRDFKGSRATARPLKSPLGSALPTTTGTKPVMTLSPALTPTNAPPGAVEEPTPSSPTLGTQARGEVPTKPRVPANLLSNLKDSPILPLILDRFLEGVRDRNYVINGLREGFDIGYKGSQSSLSSNNNASFYRYAALAAEKIDQEVELGRISGPHPEPPLDYFKSSPLSIALKPPPPLHLFQKL